jgi:hypothetical protein
LASIAFVAGQFRLTVEIPKRIHRQHHPGDRHRDITVPEKTAAWPTFETLSRVISGAAKTVVFE